MLCILNRKKSFSLIEVVITILVLTVIGATTAAFFMPMINLFFYSPSQLTVNNTAQELLNILIEGDNQAKGLRFTKSITSADKDDITFINQDNDTVRYRWDSLTNRIYRKINSQAETLVPSSYYGDITVKGEPSDSEVFQYYDATLSKLSVPVADETGIETIRIDLIFKAGSGNVKENKGKISVKAGVDIKQFG